jgi:flagellar basal-body rod protein FlgB
MLIDRLLNQDHTPVLEELLKFTAAREKLLGADIVNSDTPNYVQKDLSLPEFQKALAAKVAQSQAAAPGSVDFGNISLDVQQPNGLMFHDGNNRSMEQLMSDEAKNALMHNLAVELLRVQFTTLDMAITGQPQ